MLGSSSDKFDKFLEESVEFDQDRQLMARVAESIFEQLREVTSGRIFDKDPEVRQALATEYATMLANEYLAKPDPILAEMDIEIPDDPEELRSIMIKRAIYDTQLRDLQEREIIGVMQILCAWNERGVDEDKINQVKKSYIAGLLADGWSSDDAILQFFVRATPGEALNTDSEEDMHYIVDSLADAVILEEQSKSIYETIQHLTDVIQLNTDMERGLAQAIAVEAASIDSWTKKFGSKSDRDIAYIARREARISELCRSSGIYVAVEDSDNIVKVILEVLDAHHPLTSDESGPEASFND